MAAEHLWAPSFSLRHPRRQALKAGNDLPTRVETWAEMLAITDHELDAVRRVASREKSGYRQLRALSIRLLAAAI